jgi:hypothetical protein
MVKGEELSEYARYRAEQAWDSLPVGWQQEHVFVNHIARVIQNAIGAMKQEEVL